MTATPTIAARPANGIAPHSDVRRQVAAELRRTLDVLFQPGQVIELRIFGSKKSQIDAGYFTDHDKLIAAALKYDGSAPQYVTVNDIHPGLVALYNNQVHLWAPKTTSDNDVQRRRWLPFEFDPARPSGIPANDAEYHEAHARAQACRAWLTSQGWPEPVYADSGNGAWLLYRLDNLPVTADIERVLKACCAVVGARFSGGTPSVKVDDTVYNASRIVRLFGTRNLKGDGDPASGRIHRPSRIIDSPIGDPLNLTRLQAFVGAHSDAPAPRAAPSRKPTDTTQRMVPGPWAKDRIVALIERHHDRLAVLEDEPYDGGHKWLLEACPFDDSHRDRSAVIVLGSGGTFGFRCQHNSCSGKDGRALLALLDEAKPTKPRGPVSERIRAALHAAGYTSFALNELDNWPEVNGERLNEETRAQLLMDARDADVRPIEAVETFIIAEAARNRYHPIKNYLDGLVWDGENHIAALADHLTSSDPPVAYPSGDAPLHAVYLYRWLIGAVAKVFEQAQNLALVLAGPQNIGKSTLARWLCSGLGDPYFLEMPIDPRDKDSDLRLMRHFIWEIAELDATTRKADMSALKAFITRQTSTVRKSYGHFDTVRPTVASFIGTVNKSEGFLSDPTGNRRFLVTTITAIDRRYISAVDVNQVWAQAVALYRQGAPWRLQENELQAQADANTAHEFDTPLEGWLTAHFDTDAGDGYALTSGEIIDHLRRNYDIRLSGSERAQAMEISRTCQRLGIERRRPNPRLAFVYLGMRPKMPGEP